ncbi:hypothetical protein BU26DRAFT_309073 [Trematosphaeria pertusa]|uniref:Uncharacterized protein n=1 Tax=Trematosphaeria pertusa TaxID=390896 RepID=A0A6A6IED7_9PLEO|nr:uncharacterized protein BU26DRAFT_309073 [Trematosphaeria pertusa]KAF2248945.1 hypothetical protein BU26DRAFT_309073 [Trematosphaeria pertusa]
MLALDNHNWQSQRVLKDFGLGNRTTEFRARDGAKDCHSTPPTHLQVKGTRIFLLIAVHSECRTCQLQTVQEAIQRAHVMGALVVVITVPGSAEEEQIVRHPQQATARTPRVGMGRRGEPCSAHYIPRLGNHAAERQHSWGRKSGRTTKGALSGVGSASASRSLRAREYGESLSFAPLLAIDCLVPAPWHRKRRRAAYAEHVR